MFRVLKLHKIQPQTLLASPSPYDISAKFSGIRFKQAVEGTNHNLPKSFAKMAQDPNENLETGKDPLASMGEEYATRCEEEGFGGVIYGKNKNASKDEEENDIPQDNHANFPGSEAKEEEKDRNQNKAAA